SMMPKPKSPFQEPCAPVTCRAVFRRTSNSLAGGSVWGGIFGDVLSAATQPDVTGQAADVPLSGLPGPKASEPRKCVYDVMSGFCLNMLGMEGPCDEYPTRWFFVSQPAMVSTSRTALAPMIDPVVRPWQRPSAQGAPQLPAAKMTSMPARVAVATCTLNGCAGLSQ